MTERAVVLVPRRAGQRDRDRLWEWCRDWWTRELPELAIVEGHHDDGLFNRSAALNIAASLAGRWDVAVIIDADIVVDAGRVRESIVLARSLGRVVLPFSTRYNLNAPGTTLVMAGERGSWLPYVQRAYHDMVSSCVVVPRAVWDATGGFDETFVGWGFEDSSWTVAAETLSGRNLLYIHGELWHLHHATAPEGRPATPTFRANQARSKRYESAWGDVDAVQALIAESRQGVAA